MATTRKFTTSLVGPAQEKPVADLATQRIDTILGQIIQLDGRKSKDPAGKALTWNWRFVQVPLGSAIEDAGFREIRPRATAVSFVPDKIGIYIVELIVNNGQLDSNPITATVSIQISRVPCGENIVPDAKFMWDYISNFWALVEDRELVTSVWSSTIQLIGAELITLWGSDNNKSLVTIQNTFQRRWEAFHPSAILLKEFSQRIIAGKSDSGSEASTGNIGEEPTDGTTSTIYTTLGPVRGVTSTDFTNLRGNYGVRGRVIVVNGETYTLNRVENRSGFTLAIVDSSVIPDGQAKVQWSIPHLLHIPGLDLWELGARAGDVLILEVTRRDTGLSTELRSQVVGVDRERIGFEFTLGELEDGTDNIDLTLFEQLIVDLKLIPPESTDEEITAVAKTVIQNIPVGINLYSRPFTQYRIAFRAKALIRNTIVDAKEHLVSVPALQEKLIDPPIVLRENLDYFINDDSNIQFVAGLFTPEDPAPEVLWGECSFYNNAETIENNFGRLVELLQDDLTAKKTRSPYLSAVKGLMFAYTSGPSVSNLRLGLQILLGLPFTEVKSVIRDIQEEFTTDAHGNTLGRILTEDLDVWNRLSGFRRTYLYPLAVGLEDNPATQEPFKVGDVVEAFVPLSKGVEATDYVKDPYWWTRALQGLEFLKFFTFYATIDSEVFDADDTAFALEFLRKIKPAYTNVLSAILLKEEEDIEIEDSLTISAVIKLYDDPSGLESAQRSDDYNHQGVILSNMGSRPFRTRSLRLFRDVQTRQNGALVEAVTDEDVSYIRGRASGTPMIEGDLLFIHPGQPGAGLTQGKFYEINSVSIGSPNVLDLLQLASAADPISFVANALVASSFPCGQNLICSVVRRLASPEVMGPGLITTIPNNRATSILSNFLRDGVAVGHHLIIESGVNQGEYIIAEISATPPYISSTVVALLDLKGNVPTFATLGGQPFRIIEPKVRLNKVLNARSIFTGSRINVEVPDPNALSTTPFDVFTPGLVGRAITVFGSDQAVNDGTAFITKYIDSGTVETDAPSTTSDIAAQATITF